MSTRSTGCCCCCYKHWMLHPEVTVPVPDVCPVMFSQFSPLVVSELNAVAVTVYCAYFST